MKWIRFAGWALILSAIIFLFGFAWDHLINGPFTLVTVLIVLIGDILSLVGMWGIYRTQPQTGIPGLIAFGLIAIGTIIAIIANLLIRLGGVEIADWVPLTSASAGSLGSLILGWLTIRAKVFRPWIGWLIIVSAILDISLPVLPQGAVFISQMGLFAQAAAFFGYGITMLQRASQVSPV